MRRADRAAQALAPGLYFLAFFFFAMNRVTPSQRELVVLLDSYHKMLG